MSIELQTKWRPITVTLYAAIYAELKKDLAVHGAYTDSDGHAPEGRQDGKPYILTEWGFSCAAAPIIKSVRHGDVWEYFIAEVQEPLE